MQDHQLLERIFKKYSREHVYSYKEHVELAKQLDEQGKLPTIYMVVPPASWTDEVWDDVVRMRTLNNAQSLKGHENHICPLPIDIVERIIERFSNPEELVFDPFGGLGTVPYVAIKMGRKGAMIELNTDYYRDALGYLEIAEMDAIAPTLFDFIGEEKFHELGKSDAQANKKTEDGAGIAGCSLRGQGWGDQGSRDK